MKDLFILAVALAIPLAACRPPGSPNRLHPSDLQKSSETKTPTTVTYTQIYATADGETHFRNVTVPLISATTAPPAQPLGISEEQPATTIRFASFPAHWGDYDRENNILHTASSRRFISLIQGNVWIKTSDGETRRFEPGSVVEALDTAPSKGHITWVGGVAAFALFSNHP